MCDHAIIVHDQVIVKTLASTPTAAESLNWVEIERLLGYDETKNLIIEMSSCRTDEEVWDLLEKHGLM